MSKQNSVPRYGTKTYDLSTVRETPGEMVQVRNVSYITATSVPDTCYLRLGRENAQKIDLSVLNAINVAPFDTIYLQNPAGAGDLELVFSTFEIRTADVIREVSQITGSVTSDVSDRATRDLGKVDVAGADTTLPVEQQTPVGVEDSAGVAIDPRQQEAYGGEYVTVDLNATGTTTLYAPTTDAAVTGVYLDNAGTAAEVRLEATDGTSTAVLSDPGAGAGISFSGDLRLAGGVDSLQVVVEAAEGAALTGTAFIPRGEI